MGSEGLLPAGSGKEGQLLSCKSGPLRRCARRVTQKRVVSFTPGVPMNRPALSGATPYRSKPQGIRDQRVAHFCRGPPYPALLPKEILDLPESRWPRPARSAGSDGSLWPASRMLIGFPSRVPLARPGSATGVQLTQLHRARNSRARTHEHATRLACESPYWQLNYLRRAIVMPLAIDSSTKSTR